MWNVNVFERLLDVTTKKNLKVSEVNKVSIYAVIRWLLSNFPDLRKKNNMDLNTKRLRLNEYVGSMLNIKLGDSINRVMAYGLTPAPFISNDKCKVA